LKKNEENGLAPSKKIPHVAVVTVHAVVHEMMPDGSMHPKAVHTENFMLGVEGKTDKNCIDILKEKLERVKKEWNVKHLIDIESKKTPSASETENTQ
jgi:hypothetical protein